jgi:hypothetical protein
MTRIDSSSELSPKRYPQLMGMQPRPILDTSKPLEPSGRRSITAVILGGLSDPAPVVDTPSDGHGVLLVPTAH